MSSLRCVSLWAPWSQLWVSAAKRFETRGWPTSHRGWIAIHSSKGGLSKTEINDTLSRLHFKDVIKIDDLIKGAIIGAVYIEDCVPIEWCDECDGCGWYEGGKTIKTHCKACAGLGSRPRGLTLTDKEAAYGNYGLDQGPRFAWVASQHVQLETPIPFSARQGIFILPTSIAAQIKKEIECSTALVTRS